MDHSEEIRIEIDVETTGSRARAAALAVAVALAMQPPAARQQPRSNWQIITRAIQLNPGPRHSHTWRGRR